MIASTALRRDQCRGRGTGLRRPEKAGRGCEPGLHFKIHKKRLRQSQCELNMRDGLDNQLPSCTAKRVQVWTQRCTNIRTFRGIVDGGQDCRLWLGGMAVGPVRLIPTHVCREQNSYRRGWARPKLR